MAVFIPEWVKVSGRNVRVKRVLNALNDDHVVRRPIRADLCAADFFVQHGVKGWLAVAISELPFADLDPSQLFESEDRIRFEEWLVALQGLGLKDERSGSELATLVLMWACSTDEVRVLKGGVLDRFGIRLVSREQFVELGTKLVSGSLAPISIGLEENLLGTYFPEAEIPAVCTTRRSFRRDNSATLGRFFLDRDQEWASKLDIDLPQEQAGTAGDFSVRLVNGVAGSGKTLIAISRALLLARMFPKQRVLVLIHNTPVVADIKDKLHRSPGGLPPNVEIATFFAWANQQWHNLFTGYPRMPQGRRVLPDLVRQCRTRWSELAPSDQQLIDEMDFINQALISDEASYLEANRAGRGFALRPKDRVQVWALYETVTAALHRTGLRMWSALPRDICLAVDRHARLRKYRHIVVDEAQFFAPSWFQLVKHSSEPDGQLFMCADPNQGFLKNRLSWKSVGLDVAGRTKKLRKSYRTTKAILEAASSVLATLGRGDGEDYLEPDFEGMDEGTRPMLIYTASPQDSVDRVVGEVAQIGGTDGLPHGAMLVLYGDRTPKADLYHRLQRRLGIGSVWWFNEQTQKKEPPLGHGKDYLRLANLDTATGLEGGVVFLVGIEDLFFEGARALLNEEALAEQREANARKLYMAMTRAAQQLILVSSRKLPQDTERLFDVWHPGKVMTQVDGSSE